MDARRALEVLGLSGPVSEEALRRAYLRAVRAHGPERDPDGFSAVRAAYELLLGMTRTPGPYPLDPEPEPPAPESAGSRNAQKPPQSWRVPPRTSPPARPSAAPSPPAVPDGFVQRLADANYAGAARYLLHAWRSGDVLAAPPSDVLSCALSLFEAREFGLAAEFLREFDACTERAGSRPREFGTALIARWMLLSELAMLPGQAEVDLIVAFSAAVRSGRFGRVGRLLERALDTDESLANRLKDLAPALFAAATSAGPEAASDSCPELPTAAGHA